LPGRGRPAQPPASPQPSPPARTARLTHPGGLASHGAAGYTGRAGGGRGAFLDAPGGPVYREGVPAPETHMTNRSYRWLLFTIAAVGFAADQATKYGMFNWLYVPGQVIGQRDVIPGAFKFLVQYDSQTPAC